MHTTTRDILFSAIALSIAVAVGITSFGYAVGSSYLPRTLAVLMGLLAAGFGFRTWTSREEVGREQADGAVHLRSALIAVVGVMAYVTAMTLFGYEIATFLFLAALMRLLGAPGIALTIGLSASITVTLWGVFFVFLGAPRPDGMLF